MLLQEQTHIEGKFTALNIGPKDNCRKNYLDLLLEVQELEGRGDWRGAFKLRQRAEQLVEMKWEGDAPNLVTTVGKNLMLDTTLGSAVTVVGPFMGLISSVSYTTGPAAGDTMASHGGWVEGGGATAPTYGSPTTRRSAVWSTASGGSKALSAALAFAITGTGTVKGCFLVTGTGALSTLDNTAGTLYSAGTFTGGDKAVGSGDTLNVSYSTALN